jgi:hypothetical protein
MFTANPEPADASVRGGVQFDFFDLSDVRLVPYFIPTEDGTLPDSVQSSSGLPPAIS